VEAIPWYYCMSDRKSFLGSGAENIRICLINISKLFARQNVDWFDFNAQLILEGQTIN
jgi:hypothetical protein